MPFLLLFVAVAVTPKPLAMLLGQLSRWRLLRQVFEFIMFILGGSLRAWNTSSSHEFFKP